MNGNPFLFGLLTGLVCAILHFVFKRTKIWLSTILLIAGVAANLIAGVILNNNGIAISLIYAPLVLIVSYIYCLAIGYILEKLKQKKVLKAFKKYVAPEIVDEISKKGDFHIKLGGENRDIAVLFVDIRGFTTMSEVLEPEQVVEILNSYLALTTEAIFKTKVRSISLSATQRWRCLILRLIWMTMSSVQYVRRGTSYRGELH